MKAHIITDGIVTNTIVVDSLDFMPGLIDGEHGGAIGDLWDGATFTPPPSKTKTAQEVQTEIVTAVQARLDTFAQTRHYDGILSAATYASSTVPKFAAEGQCAVNARDATWATLYTLLAEIQAGTRQMPGSYADIESLLPSLVWPA